MGMNVIIAPDSFKGSCTAREAAEYIARGVTEVFPDAAITLLPIADGGEGTVDSLVAAAKGRFVSVATVDPLDRPIAAQYGVLPDGTVVVEAAAASGLTLVALEERDAMRASTYGTGLLLRHALENGAKKILIGLGGTATTDGGMGIGRALGISFLDAEGKPLADGGAELARLDKIDVSGLMPQAKECEFILACDVKNTLCGENGAAYVFSPQKGANAQQVQQLDAALANYARVLATMGSDVANRPSSGAAGGLGCVFMAFLNAGVRSGIDLVLDTIGFDNHVRDADMVITGEGRLDAQSACGKVPCGVATRTKAVRNIPVIAIGGAIADGAETLYSCGVDTLVSSISEVTTLQTAMQNAEKNITSATVRAMRLVKLGMTLTE